MRADSFKTDWNLVVAAVNGIAYGAKTVTYSATMAIDGNDGICFAITATDTSAFTVSQPTNLVAGQIYTFVFKNSSGGTMGAPTLTGFKLGAAFDKPADGKVRVYTFVNSGGVLYEVSRTAADITP